MPLPPQVKSASAGATFYVSGQPDQCPYCHIGIDPIYRYASNSIAGLELVFQCTKQKCERMFIGYYTQRQGSSQAYYYTHSSFGTGKSETFEDVIRKVSPKFSVIYNQAFKAEQQELDQIAGMGYRKSLEFLVKDFLINQFPDNEETIKKLLLGQCIDKYVTSEKLKTVAKRAAWLGNDETHYTRIWEGKDITDLKQILKMCVHYVAMELESNELESSMPDANKS